MNLRKTLIAAALGGAIGVPGVASAITIDGITFDVGSIFELGELWEAEKLDFVDDGNGGLTCANPLANCNGYIDQIGEELVGVGVITSIRRADSTVLWEDGDNNRQLTIYFDSFIAEGIIPTTDPFTGEESVRIVFSGGNVKLFSQTYVDGFDPTTTQAGGIARATQGNLWLELTGAPILDTTAFGSAISLVSTAEGINPLDPLRSGSVGGRGRLDVVLRDDTFADDYLDTNTFGCTVAGTEAGFCPYESDKAFESVGGLQPAPGTGEWVFSGNVTVRDFAVPEPGTLALLGAGLMGIGLRRRKTA